MKKKTPPKRKVVKIPRLTQLKLWMRVATVAEQEALAKHAGTSRATLYLVASGHRNFSAAKAGLIEDAAAQLHATTRGRLPKLYRSDLAVACASCGYAQKCLGPITRRSEFPVGETK